MTEQEKFFFNDTTYRANKFLRTILLYANFIPLLLFLGNLSGIVNFSLKYLLAVQVAAILGYAANYFVAKKLRNPLISRNSGMISSIILLGIISSNFNAGIYISYGFFPFVSALYYSRNFTRATTFSAFLVMILTMIYKTYFFTPEHAENFSRISYFFTYIIGYSFDLFLTYLLAMHITGEGRKTLRNFFASIDESNSMNLELTEKNIQLEETQSEIIQFISKILGSHDFFTGNHVIHTKAYVGIIARDLKKRGIYADELTDENVSMFETAALLHDIGKIHIPEGVLNKADSVNSAEFEIIKCHPEEGKRILDFLPPIQDGKFNEIAKEMALYHHEKWDGSGYPFALKEKQIPLCARIMAAADVVDALLSQRLYKDAFSVDETMNFFAENRGIHFEPEISDSVVNCREKIAACDEFFKKEEEKENVMELEWWKNYHSAIEKQSSSEKERIS
jgi:HD-GYP domain-containing protein (c-di-GMP phosphodiesterase class II)